MIERPELHLDGQSPKGSMPSTVAGHCGEQRHVIKTCVFTAVISLRTVAGPELAIVQSLSPSERL